MLNLDFFFILLLLSPTNHMPQMENKWREMRRIRLHGDAMT